MVETELKGFRKVKKDFPQIQNVDINEINLTRPSLLIEEIRFEDLFTVRRGPVEDLVGPFLFVVSVVPFFDVSNKDIKPVGGLSEGILSTTLFSVECKLSTKIGKFSKRVNYSKIRLFANL